MKFTEWSMIFFSITIIGACGRLSNNNNPKDKNYLGYDIELFDETEVKSISISVRDEETEKIRSFFAKNSELVNIQEPKFGFTLLMWAVFNHKMESVKSLLESGANPNIPSKKGVSPLIRAAEFDELPMMKLLIEFGADPHYMMDSLPPASALVASISGIPTQKKQDLEKVKYLLDLGVNMDSTNANSSTPLNTAVILDAFEIAEFLIQKGANINIPVYNLPNGKIVFLPKMLKEMEIESNFNYRHDSLVKYVEQKIDTTWYLKK
jgi:ankyrin repeat protein